MKQKIYAIVMRDCDSKPEVAKFEYLSIPDETLRVYADNTPLDLLVEKACSSREREEKSLVLSCLKHVNSSSYFGLVSKSDAFINQSYFEKELDKKWLMRKIEGWKIDARFEKFFTGHLFNRDDRMKSLNELVFRGEKMLIPKEVVDKVCIKCNSWYADHAEPFGATRYCHSYAHDCDKLVDYSFELAKNDREKAEQASEESLESLMARIDATLEKSKENSARAIKLFENYKKKHEKRSEE